MAPYSGFDLLSKNEGHKKFTNGLLFKTNLGTAIKEKNNCNVGYLPSALDRHTGIESRRKTDYLEWKLSSSVFQRLCMKMEIPLTDLFASRVFHQLPTYVA